MNTEISIRITGQAGQGMQTIGDVICKACKISGLYLFSNQDYMSRIRGGNNFFQIRIADHPVFTLRESCDIIIALDKESVNIHKNFLTDNGILFTDKNKFQIKESENSIFDFPMYQIANEYGGKDIFVNSVASGAICAMTDIPFDVIEKILVSTFQKKGQEIVDANLKAAKAGYEYVNKNTKLTKFKIDGTADKESLLLDGNEAIALGALKAGCKFYSAYPMTPSTTIMETICKYAKEFNVVVEQAEDEIAAINMIIGASFAGVRAMTGTSGGGFALMNEGISLAAMTETPIVVVDGQRPAPATGFPTRTEQADLDFVIHAGHGEFAKAVYAPGTIEEAFFLTVKAFDIAEKYQIPVIILTDQHLADSVRNINSSDLKSIKVQRHIISKEESINVENYKRYTFTESGISPRAIPSWINDVMYVGSDEHTEDGHITEDSTTRINMVEKRFYKKMSGLREEIISPRSYNINNADIVIVGFGSTYGVMKEIAETERDRKVGFIHLSQVWPFPAKEITELLKNSKNIITVENNAGAQLAKLMRRETGIAVHGSILKYDGRPFSLDYLKMKLDQEKY